MNTTKIFTGLALAAALLIAQPAFGYEKRGGAVVSHGGSVAHYHSVAVVPRGSALHVAAYHGPRGGTAVYASRNRYTGRTYAASNYGYRGTRNAYAGNRYGYGGTRNTVAFGGSSRSGHGSYAFAYHDGWNHGRAYFWHGHHYRWYDNGWFIVDPFPVGYGYGYGYYGPDYGYYNDGTPVSVQVQQALYNQGYYQGPIDGIVGPGTQSAIAQYQQDNGLPVTGTITPALLNNLGIG